MTFVSRIWAYGIVLTAAAALAAPPPGKGYVKVFEDNFELNRLDTTKWSHNYPWGTTHNHMANMRPQQVVVTNGTLVITALAERSIWEPWGQWHDGFNKYIPFDYTSGAINTSGKHHFTHGYIEGRFKLPTPLSTWPAFWTLQEGWPPEIDILEVQGDRHRLYYNYHYGPDWTQHQSFGGQYWGPDLSQGWHTYGVEWTANEMIFYFDDLEIARYWRPEDIAQAKQMYLIINLAVGGWAPDPVAADYPARLECDWVRVYQTAAPVLAGSYRLVNKKSGKLMEVEGGDPANGANVIQNARNQSDYQIWNLTSLNNGYYHITNQRTRKSPDVWNWSTSDGGDIRQYDATGGNNQQFRFEAVGNGYYRINNRHSNKYIVVLNGAVTNGASVIQWSWNGSDDQRWFLEPLPPRVQCAKNGGTVTLTWNTTPGQSYRVQYKDSLNAAQWNDLPGDVVATSTQATKVDASAGVSDGRWYRVTVVLP